MAAVSLFWGTNMAAVTSCENTLYTPKIVCAHYFYSLRNCANKLGQYLGFFLFAHFLLKFSSQNVRNLQALKEQERFFFFLLSTVSKEFLFVGVGKSQIEFLSQFSTKCSLRVFMVGGEYSEIFCCSEAFCKITSSR